MGSLSDRTQGDHGFTMVEIAFVVVLMSILLLIAVATFGASTNRANAAACRSNQDALNKAITIAVSAGETPDDISDLEPYVEGFDKAKICPEDGTPLELDAATMTVTCPNHDL